MKTEMLQLNQAINQSVLSDERLAQLFVEKAGFELATLQEETEIALHNFTH
jgi:hypothetical protein